MGDWARLNGWWERWAGVGPRWAGGLHPNTYRLHRPSPAHNGGTSGLMGANTSPSRATRLARGTGPPYDWNWSCQSRALARSVDAARVLMQYSTMEGRRSRAKGAVARAWEGASEGPLGADVRRAAGGGRRAVVAGRRRAARLAACAFLTRAHPHSHPQPDPQQTTPLNPYSPQSR